MMQKYPLEIPMGAVVGFSPFEWYKLLLDKCCPSV